MNKALGIGTIVVVAGIFALAGFLLWQMQSATPTQPSEEQQAVQAKRRNDYRLATMTQFSSAMQIYYGKEDEYPPVASFEEAVERYRAEIESVSFREPGYGPCEHYGWIPNTQDSQRYCAWACLEDGEGYRAVSHKGAKYLSSPPTSLECWSEEQVMMVGEEIDTSNWQTHRDEFGFEARYPRGWIVEGTRRIINPTTGSSFEVVFNGNPNNLSLDEWFKQATLVGGRPTAKAAAERVTINGIPAYKLETGLAPANPLFEVVAIANKQNTIFSIHGYYGAQEDAEVLNKMLSTFRFLGFTVLSPNGGEELVQGEEYEIRWTSTFPETDSVSIYLVSRKCWEENCFTDAMDYRPTWPDATVIVPELKQFNTGSFVWKVPALETFMYYPYTPEEAKEVERYSEAPPGEYKIVVMRNYEVRYGRTYDESDGFFTIK